MENKSARMQTKYASMSEMELANKITSDSNTNFLFRLTKQKKSRQEMVNYTILMKEMGSRGINESTFLKSLITLEDMSVLKILPDNSTIELTGKGESIYRALPNHRN